MNGRGCLIDATSRFYQWGGVIGRMCDDLFYRETELANMKSLLPFLVFGLLVASTEAVEPKDQLPALPDGKIWKLVWQDEFEGDKVDEGKLDVPA